MKVCTYDEISSSRTKASQLEKVYALVVEFPFRTARELSQKVNDHIITAEAIHKRLPELRKLGRVVNPSLVRRCTVTHKKAQTWVRSGVVPQESING